MVPKWPAQACFPLYMKMLTSKAVYFQPHPNLLLTFNRQRHPVWDKITLVAGVLSKEILK